MPKPIRIQKVLSDGGILSRRKTEEYIQAGRITVNGHKASLGHPVHPADVIAIDGVRVRIAKRKENLYIMLNKPRGYVTTTSDELGRRCVAELVEDVEGRVYPVGRLDRDSEGLLLFTNDGQFANLIMHPSHHIGKTYRVTVRPGVSEEQCIALSSGVDIGKDGVKEMTAPATVLVLEKYPDRAVVQITINEGKNRQVRRMCEAVGLEVARLKRTAVGPLRLGMLQPGKWRELKKSEVIALRNAGGGVAPAGGSFAPGTGANGRVAPAGSSFAPVPGANEGGKPKGSKRGSAGSSSAPGTGARDKGKPKGSAPTGKAAKAPGKGAKRGSPDGMSRDKFGGVRFREEAPAGGRPRRAPAPDKGGPRPAPGKNAPHKSKKGGTGR